MIRLNKEEYKEYVIRKSKRSPLSRYQGYFKVFLEPNIEFLYDNGIHEPPDAIELFKSIKMKNKDVQTLMNSFVSDYNYHQVDPNKRIEWNKRSFKQIKFELKNFVIIRIIYQYEECFLEFLHQCNFTQIKDNNEFFTKLDEIIQKLKIKHCYIDEKPHIEIIENDKFDFANINNDDDDDNCNFSDEYDNNDYFFLL